MEDVTAPTLPLTVAASAAGLRLSYVKSLLAEARITLLARPLRHPSKPPRASIVDVLRFALLRRLRDAGLSDAQAVWVLDLAVDPLLGGLCGAGLALPRVILADRLHGRVFHVIPDDGDEMPDVYSTPSGCPVPGDAPVAFTITLSAVLADVFAALDAHTSTAADVHDRSTGRRTGAAAGLPPPSLTAPTHTAGIPAMES